MRIAGLMIVMASTLAFGATPPASGPSTGPATLPMKASDMEPLADGTVRYVPPFGWTLLGKNPDGLGATYRSADESAVIAITVMPQDRAIQESSRDGMARIIDKGIREAAAKEGHAVVISPKEEDDSRFFLKMHDAIRVEGKIADRIQMYRVIGLNLVLVAATANVDSIEQAKIPLGTAEQLAATMRVSRGSKRMVYPHAQLRAVVPLDWTDQKTDQPNGLVATYSDPKDRSRQIILGARIIPKAALDDKEKLKTLVATMVDQERKLPAQLSTPLATQTPQEEDVAGTTYLRQTRMNLAGRDGPARIETRYLAVGDVLVSVRSVSSEADADEIGKIADRFAANLKPVKD